METLTTEELEIQSAIEAPQIAPPVETPAADVKRRGRPKGSTKAVKKESPVNFQGESRHRAASIDDIRNQVSQNAERINHITPEGNQVPNIMTNGTPEVANLIDGYIVLLMMDAICPAAIKMIFKKKFANVPAQSFSLSDGQKKSIEPLADQIAKYLVGYVNPLYAFFIVSGLMYYQNAQEVLSRTQRK
jgi:hypothetical protein